MTPDAGYGDRASFFAPCCYSENTYSTSAWRISRSSGVLINRPLDPGLGPEMIATYCFPLTSNVIGGAEKPEPTLIFHNSYQGGIVVGGDSAVEQRGEDQPPAGRQCARIVTALSRGQL